MKTSTSIILILFLSILMGGCSKDDGTTTPVTPKPTISDLSFEPPVVTFKPNTTFVITGTIRYENAASGVSKLKLYISYGGDLTVDIDPNTASSGMLSGLFELLMPDAPGTYTFEVWIIDGKGASSNKLTGSVNIVLDESATIWREASRSYSLHRMVWGNNQYVGVGEGGTIVTSPDGMNWRTENSGTTNTLYGVDWTGTQYVAVGFNKTILTSPDGVNWTIRMNEISGITLYGVASSGINMVAVGSEYSTRTVEIYVSNDGINWWNTYREELAGSLNSVRWVAQDNRYVAVGGYPLVLTSSVTAATWIKCSISVPGELTDLAFSGNTYAAVGYGLTAVSSDALNWTASTANWGAAGIVWSGQRFVAAGLSGIMVSANGTNWTQSYESTFPLRGIAWSGTQYVAFGFVFPLILVSP